MFTSRVASLVRNLLGRTQVERELDEELRAFVDLRTDELRASGLSEAAARRQALVELGGLDQVKERVRDVRAGAVVDQIRQDLVYAVRLLRKNVAFTAVAVATLALGVGANAAVFSIVDTVVFRPLPYADPDRLIKMCGSSLRSRTCVDDFSAEELDALRARSDVFQTIAADDGTGSLVIRPDGSTEPIGLGLVSANWLSTLGVQPIVGRDFDAGRNSARPRSRASCSRTTTGGAGSTATDRSIGRTINVDGVVHTIIGVLPPNVLRAYADVLKPLVLIGYSDRSLDCSAACVPA